MSFQEQAMQIFTYNNIKFLLDGLGLTLYISFVAIVLSTVFDYFCLITDSCGNRVIIRKIREERDITQQEIP